MRDNDAAKLGIIFIAFIITSALCGLSTWAERDLNSTTFGISRFEAAKLKDSCEKSLPRDEKCVPKLIYEVK